MNRAGSLVASVILISISLAPLYTGISSMQPMLQQPTTPPDTGIPDHISHAEDDGILTGIPTHFTINAGQRSNGRIRYYSEGGSLTAGFYDGGIMYLVNGKELSWAYNVTFRGGREAEPIGTGALSHVSNYFLGSDESSWLTDVPHYSGIRYADIYSGIDLEFYIADGSLKYDFLAGPGSDTGSIVLSFEGATLSIEDRKLHVTTPAGTVVEDEPHTYLDNGEEIGSWWILISETEAAFGLEDYDRRESIRIDPGLFYSTFVGGTGFDQARDMTIDKDGFAYMVGRSASGDFPTTSGAYDTTFNGGTNGDVVVLKMNQTGQSLVFSTYLGGMGNDYGYGIHVDSSKDIYVTGLTYSNNFPTTAGAYDQVYAWVGDVFVTKIRSSGNSLRYSTYIGLYGTDIARSINVDSSGYAYITGYTTRYYHYEQYNYPTTSGAYDTSHNGPNNQNDAFVTKLNTDGSGLEYSTFLGGGGQDYGMDIDIDSSGYAYVTGYTASNNFPHTSNAYQGYREGGWDLFVTKFNTAGSGLSWSTYIGGDGNDQGYNIKLDSDGRACITGTTSSGSGNRYPTTTGAYDTTYNGGTDAFFTRLASDAQSLDYSTFIGGSAADQSRRLVLGADGYAYLAGYTLSANFPTSTDGYQQNIAGGNDAFIFKLNATSGGGMVYSTYLGGSGNDYAWCIDTDSDGFIYVSGETTSNNFPVSRNPYQSGRSGNSDIFVTKFFPADFSPKSLSTTSGYFKVNLSWSRPASSFISDYGLTKYTIYRGETQSSMAPIANVTGRTWFEDPVHIFISKQYYYRVTATFHTIGESRYSNIAQGTPSVTPPPDPPVTNAGDLYVNITWPLLSQGLLDMFEVTYTLYKGLTEDFLFILGEHDEQTDWHNDTDIPNIPRSYRYAVRYSLEGIGPGLLSDIVTAKPNTCPAPPTNFTTRPGNLRADINWSEPLDDGGYGISGFTLYRGYHPLNMESIAQLDGLSHSHVDTDITPGMVYFYSVSAANPLGESEETDTRSELGQTVPSGPRYFMANAGDGIVKLSWQPPTFTWGLPISRYNVYRGTAQEEAQLIGEISPKNNYLIDEAENGVEYLYEVSATNVYGEGARVGPVPSIPNGLPGEILDAGISIGDATATITWSGVENDGGRPLTKFNIYRCANTSDPQIIAELPPGSDRFVDTGLENGASYYYWISAENENGEGPIYGEILAKPGTTPGTIAALSATPELYSARITWSPPEDDGGEGIGAYLLYRGNSSTGIQPYTTLPATETAFTVLDLEADKSYHFAVAARNIFGDGDMSPTVVVSPYGQASPPVLDVESVGNITVRISWTVPEDDGGSRIMGYMVEHRPQYETVWSRHETRNTSFLIPDLNAGWTYEIRVLAFTVITEGVPSDIVSILLGSAPDRPQSLEAIKADRSILLKWSPPSKTGIPLEGFRIYMKGAGDQFILFGEVKGKTNEFLVEGLRNGEEYIFYVSAFNIKGEGPRSAPAIAIPSTVPGPVNDIWIDAAGDRFVRIEWTPPEDDGGKDILSYLVFRGIGSNKPISIITTTWYVDDTVENGRTHHYSVKAVNGNGEGPDGKRVDAVPVGVPTHPSDFSASATSDTVTLNWGVPEENGGSPITGYLLYRGKDSNDMVLIAALGPNETVYTDRAIEGGRYHYKVEAVNRGGNSEGALASVEVPSRMLWIILAIVIAFIIPLALSLLTAYLPRHLRKRREEKERRLAALRESERLKEAPMRGPQLPGIHRGMGLPQGHVGGPMMAPHHTLPPSVQQKFETTRDETGYIRPTEMKKAKKDRKTILRADGKSIKEREKLHSPLAGATPVKKGVKGTAWEGERKKAIEKEAGAVFTGQQPAEAAHDVKTTENAGVDEAAPPSPDDLAKEPSPPEKPSEEEVEEIPVWGEEEEEIPLQDLPLEDPEVVPIEDVEEIPEDIEEIEEVEELEDPGEG